MTDPILTVLLDETRLVELHRLQLFENDCDPAFDRFTSLASMILNVPVSLITLVDRDRQYFKSQIGLNEPFASQRQTPLSYSLCKYVVALNEPFIVENALIDPRIDGNLAVTELHFQSYCGAPITSPDGSTLGAFCIIDHIPRQWTDREIAIVCDLAQSIITEISLRHEIHQREKTEQELREREQRYRALFTQTHDAVFLISTDLVHIDVNQQAADLLGYSREELIGMPTSQIVAPQAYAESRNVLQMLMEGKSVPIYERLFRHRDGHEIPVEINVALIRDSDGKPLYIQSMVRNITHRRSAERALEFLLEKQSQQHALLDSILQSMADGVVVADHTGQVTLYNHAAQQMLGFGGTSGAEWWDHYPTFYADKVTPYDPIDFPLRKAIKGGFVDGEEIFIQHPDLPNGLFTSRSARPIRDAEGNVTGGVVVIHNINRLKESEEMNRRLNAELSAANIDLEAFGHTIAHDLKAPLHIMSGYAEFLMDSSDMLSPEMQQMIHAISYSVDRMSGMINSLLLFAKLRNVEETLRPVELRPVIDAAIERTTHPLQDRGIVLQISDNLPSVIGYGPWLEEVFANLLSNAVKYMGLKTSNPRIEIRATRRGDVIRCEVSDNGLGITEKDQSKLFQMFQRFHEGHSEGTGLGLSIVARIIAKLGGQIGVISTPGSGSTFWFTLPAAESSR